jgi:hypothetical protein
VLVEVQNGVTSLQTSPSIDSNCLCRSVRFTVLKHFISNKSLILGDARLLHAARVEARHAFQENATLSPDSPKTAAAVAHAEEVAQILKENVVQGKKEGDNLYSQLFCFGKRVTTNCDEQN